MSSNNPPPTFVLVMGPTGVGKSNFIDNLLGGTTRAGTSLRSHTTNIKEYRDNGALRHLGLGKISIIDTPGFDDTSRSDYDILRSVSDWMSTAYKEHYKISAIIYLHRITDNRVGGASMRNLRTFGKLTGENSAKKIWMVTTMWDHPKLDRRSARAHQAQLETEIWRPLIELGAQATRFFNTPQSAQDVLNEALHSPDQSEAGRRQRVRTTLLLQEEMEELGKQLRETEAGKELFNDLQRQLAQQKDTLAALQAQTSGTSNDALSKALQAQLDQVENDLETTITSIEQLKIPFFRKLYLIFFGKSSSVKGIEFY